MIFIKPYTYADRDVWNDFNCKAKNGLFLFHRNYMDYHANRFTDSSLMVYYGNKLAALLPANREERVLYSHKGLTFGGVISDRRMSAGMMLEVFTALIDWLRENEFEKLAYKAIPYIFHSVPAQEDLYAIYIFNGKLIRRDLSSVIDMANRLPLSKGRKQGLKKAIKTQLIVQQVTDYPSFMALVEQVISKHGVKPTHTIQEMELLANRFPENIKLFCSLDNKNKLLAGTIVYEYGNVAHTQYMASSDEGKMCGALDFLINTLIEEIYKDNTYFSFGISTEQEGRYLNQGLLAQKNMFGARAIVHDWYEIPVH